MIHPTYIQGGRVCERVVEARGDEIGLRRYARRGGEGREDGGVGFV